MDKGPVLIIPPSRLSDILDRPEDEIALREPQHEFVQASYTIRDKDIYINDFHFNVVKKQLTRNLSLLTTDIEEELAIGFKHHWGASTDWTTVRVWDSVLKIVAQAVNRVYIGVPLCRYTNRSALTTCGLRGSRSRRKLPRALAQIFYDLVRRGTCNQHLSTIL